jgi:hypothetical protein
MKLHSVPDLCLRSDHVGERDNKQRGSERRREAFMHLCVYVCMRFGHMVNTNQKHVFADWGDWVWGWGGLGMGIGGLGLGIEGIVLDFGIGGLGLGIGRIRFGNWG